MTWQSVASVQLTKDWQLTEPIIGNVFRLKHTTNTNRPQDLRAVVAQAYDENNLLTCFNDKVVTLRSESQGFIFSQVEGILNRKFALKRLDNLTDNWIIQIEVLDGMPESISLPIAVSEVTGLQEELNGKAAAESLNIHVADIQNPHGVTAAQIGAEPAGAGNAAAVEAIALHLFDEDPHPQYATDAMVALVQTAVNTKETTGTTANAIAFHESTTNHPLANGDTEIGSAGFMSRDDKEKLDTIEMGATANASNAQLRDRSTHTGTQPISTIINLQSAIEARELIGVAANLIANLTAAQIPQTLPTATTIDYEGAIAANGILSVNGLVWLLLDGATIGNASSGATRYADSKAQTLFERLWTNPNLLIFTSTGGTSTKGASAVADFGASKRLALPDPRGRIIIPAGQGSGLALRNRGQLGGAETHTLTNSESPNHQHDITVFPANNVVGGVTGAISTTAGTGHGFFGITGTSTTPIGGGNAHNNMPPFYVSAGKLILAGKA